MAGDKYYEAERARQAQFKNWNSNERVQSRKITFR